MNSNARITGSAAEGSVLIPLSLASQETALLLVQVYCWNRRNLPRKKATVCDVLVQRQVVSGIEFGSVIK